MKQLSVRYFRGGRLMKTNYLKWLLFVFTAVILGLVTSHFSDTISFYESTTMIIASLALLRTCKEEK
jgi:hypothetical protein